MRRGRWSAPVLRAAFVAVSFGLIASAATPRASGQSAAPDPTSDDALAYPLEGTRWRLDSVTAAGATRPTAPDIVAWLRLGEGRVSGSTGCANLRGTYATGSDVRPPEDPPLAGPTPAPSASIDPGPTPTTIADDARLAFDGVRAGDRECAEQSMLVARSVLDGLASTAGFRLEPAASAWELALELSDATGAPVLRFRVDDAGSLTGTTWLLESVDGTPALVGGDGQPAILALDEPGRADPGAGRRVSGSTGCNSFSSTYAATGNVLSIGQVTVTTAGCAAALTEQERVVLDILDATSLRVSLPPGALELRSDDDGRTLRYRAAAPLQDQTWILGAREAGRLGSDAVVTLYLAADAAPRAETGEGVGTVSGEGPCRSYTGRYRSDGLLVTFEAVRAGGGRCAERGVERRFLRALRRAVFAEVDRGRLRLRDGQGRIVLVFQTPGLP